MICFKCKINYPSELVQLIYTSSGNAKVCGICALEISNEINGIDRKEFLGKQAEVLRQKAIKFREGLK